LLDFLFGAGAAAVFVLLLALIASIAGVVEPARGSWGLFAFAGLLLLFAFAQRSPTLFGAGVGGIGATSAFVLWAARRIERRNQEARSAADELGLSYKQEPPSPDLHELAGELTSTGSRNKLQRVLSGRWSGDDVAVFDYYYEINGSRGTVWQRNFTCALISVPFDNEPVTITNETLLTKIGAKLGYGDLELGDTDFDRLFRVRSKDTTVTRQILRPEVRGWLAENGRGLSFLVGRNAVLCMAKAGTISRAEILDLASRFAGLVSGDRMTSTAAAAEKVRQPVEETVGDVEGDRPPAWPGQEIATGLVLAIVALVALVGGAYLLFYVACATGRGCL